MRDRNSPRHQRKGLPRGAENATVPRVIGLPRRSGAPPLPAQAAALRLCSVRSCPTITRRGTTDPDHSGSPKRLAVGERIRGPHVA